MRSTLVYWLLIAALVALPIPALAGPQVLSWDQVSNATSYGIEQSTDLGVTWIATVPTVGPTCTGSAPGRCTATVTSPSSGFVYYRFWAQNNIGRSVRFGVGVWVCESCAPPPLTPNVGVQ